MANVIELSSDIVDSGASTPLRLSFDPTFCANLTQEDEDGVPREVLDSDGKPIPVGLDLISGKLYARVAKQPAKAGTPDGDLLKSQGAIAHFGGGSHLSGHLVAVKSHNIVKKPVAATTTKVQVAA